MSLGHLTAAAIAAILALPDLAQAQATAPLLREADNNVLVQPFNKSAGGLEDEDLVNQAGDDIGDIEKVLVDANGQPAAIVAEVGGFLGMGEKTVIIGLDQLQFRDDDVVTTLSKEQLGTLQPWDD